MKTTNANLKEKQPSNGNNNNNNNNKILQSTAWVMFVSNLD